MKTQDLYKIKKAISKLNNKNFEYVFINTDSTSVTMRNMILDNVEAVTSMFFLWEDTEKRGNYISCEYKQISSIEEKIEKTKISDELVDFNVIEITFKDGVVLSLQNRK